MFILSSIECFLWCWGQQSTSNHSKFEQKLHFSCTQVLHSPPQLRTLAFLLVQGTCCTGSEVYSYGISQGSLLCLPTNRRMAPYSNSWTSHHNRYENCAHTDASGQSVKLGVNGSSHGTGGRRQDILACVGGVPILCKPSNELVLFLDNSRPLQAACS